MLPDDWSELKDPASGHAYFYNSKTNETTWVRPQAADPGPPPGPPPPSAKSDALPEGWQSATDEGSGHVYYWNAGTGERSWERPQQPKLEAAPAPQGPEQWQPEAARPTSAFTPLFARGACACTGRLTRAAGAGAGAARRSQIHGGGPTCGGSTAPDAR